jgi:hypothetical protein
MNIKHRIKKILISGIISMVVIIFLVFNNIPLYKIIIGGITIWLGEYGLLTTIEK